LTANLKLAIHVQELVWFELAEDEDVFFETATDPMPQLPHDGLRNSIHHDNHHTLLEMGDMAARLFWLPSVPNYNVPRRQAIEAERQSILTGWFPGFYRALEAMPKLDTFTSRPMPAHHVLSLPLSESEPESESEYEFVAYHFQVNTRSIIQGYQRNDGLFSVLLPAMAHLAQTIKHLQWADKTHGTSSSIMRLRYSHRVSFKHLTSLDLCLCLPLNPFIQAPWHTSQAGHQVTCWSILGECIHRVRRLSDVSLCFEMADPRSGWTLS
jgi:hypothetical protein